MTASLTLVADLAGLRRAASRSVILPDICNARIAADLRRSPSLEAASLQSAELADLRGRQPHSGGKHHQCASGTGHLSHAPPGRSPVVGISRGLAPADRRLHEIGYEPSTATSQNNQETIGKPPF
jgi:hypothetical protein